MRKRELLITGRLMMMMLERQEIVLSKTRRQWPSGLLSAEYESLAVLVSKVVRRRCAHINGDVPIGTQSKNRIKYAMHSSDRLSVNSDATRVPN